MSKQAKKQYNLLLKEGMLLDMYGNLSGIWEEDRNKFLDIYETEQFYTNNIEVIDEEYYGEE
jgi:hypothetical protein